MSKIFLSSTLLWDASIDEMFDFIKNNKLAGIELWTQHFISREFDVQQYKERAEFSGFETIVHSVSWDLNFASLNKKIRRASIDEIKASIDLAAKLGADEITVHPPKETLSGDKSMYVELTREGLNELYEYSKERNVNISLEIMENISNQLIIDAKTLREVTEELYDNFRYTLDIAHCNNYVEFDHLYKQIKNISKIHISNKKNKKLHTKLADGDYNFFKIFPLLESKNVSLVVEGFEKGKSFSTAIENLNLIKKIKESTKCH